MSVPGLPVSEGTHGERPLIELRIKCARCGRPMIAQTEGATLANDAMEVCSECSWQIAQDSLADAWDEGADAANANASNPKYPLPTNPFRAFRSEREEQDND